MDKLKWKTKFTTDFANEVDFLDTILESYGVQDVQSFLNPNKKDINDPFLMKNMEGGVRLFHEVIGMNKPKICIKIDCD